MSNNKLKYYNILISATFSVFIVFKYNAWTKQRTYIVYIYKHLYRIWLRKLHSLKWIVHFHLVLMATRQQKNSKAMKRGVKYFYKFLKQNTFSLAIRVMQQNFFDKIQTSIFKGVQSPQILSSLNCAISLNWAPVFKHIFFRTSTSHLNLDYVYPSPTLPNKMIHVYRRHNVFFIYFGIITQLN